jgi:hypothetical protein
MPATKILPAKGMLSFFLQNWYDANDYLSAGAVFWFEDVAALEPRAIPAGEELEPHLEPASLTGKSLLMLPGPEGDYVRELGLDDDELRTYWDGVWLDHTGDGPLHWLLGFPGPSYQPHMNDATIHLAQIDEDPRASLEMGAGTAVRFYAKALALKARKFSRITVDSSDR